MAVESQTTSWGRAAKIEDIRALRRYNSILRGCAFAGEMLVYAMLVITILVAGWFLFNGNFENAVFTDGTSLTCFMDGATGEITNVK